MADQELPSAALIAAGRCPGWVRDYGWGDNETGYYAADWQVLGKRQPWASDRCKHRATRGDLCGRHDNMRTRDQEKAERTKRIKAAQARCNAAATRLSDRLGVRFEPDGTKYVAVPVASAEALADWLEANDVRVGI